MPEDVQRTVGLALLVLVAVGVVGLFVVDAGSTTPEPAMFDETVPVGLTLEDELELEGVDLPRAQVFYAQYQYVVGYYGVETFVETQREAGHEQRFGHPLTVYVSDYSDSGLELTDEGYPVADRTPAWTDAESAWFVTDSEARSQTGETVLPFSDREDADAFAERHGGTVRSWESVLEVPFETDDAAVARDRVDDYHRLADERLERTEPFTERELSIVVGEDAATAQEAIDRAPENTTVVLPEGTYEETIEIDRPLTLAGDGDVTLQGDGNGSVVTVTGEQVAIQDLDVAGVGNVTTAGEELPVEVDEEAWDATFTQYYAGTDAGIAAYDADELRVTNVGIETPASGIIAYASADAVVQNVSVDGPEDPMDGLAGILLFQSPSVVESSTTTGGTNGIYTYRSPETVVRSNTLEGNRLGIHLMHTDDSLFANNELRNQSSTGLYVMTGPERNAIVDNTAHDAEVGFSIGGSDTYVAGNVAAGNELGVRVESTASIYEDNVLAGNDIGADVIAVLPTNRVVGNDFVGNADHATATSGPLRLWSDEDVGNYWQGGAGVAAGDVADRSYSPTDDVDRRLHLTDGTRTLVRSPALSALAGLEGSVPGMRTGSIVDQAPTCEPNHPDVLDELGWTDQAWPCYETTRYP